MLQKVGESFIIVGREGNPYYYRRKVSLMLIGDKIRELRTQKDISQQELAKVIGVSDQAISQWENNKKQPRMGSVEKLANYFNVPKSYLIEDSIDMDKVVASTAIAGAAGLVVGGPIMAAVMGTIAAVGKMVNTIDSHTSQQVKEATQLPFLMTKDEDEKEILQMYRALPEEKKATIRVLLNSFNEKTSQG